MIEESWVRRAQEGDRKALIRLLRKVEAPVYRTAYYILGDEQDAKDASQDALLRIYRRFSTFRGDSKVETWAQRIAIRAAIDLTRKRTRTLPLAEEAGAKLDRGLGSSVERSGIASDIRQAIRRLPESQRTAVILRYLQDYTYDEIAEAMDLPLNTVKSHLFRGRKKLREWLADYKEGGVIP
ncbi:RNA polymerase subunit sigma [Paludifilum halophilum]|uniref:RNA polymerase subunit sigma n=1 Tax=Paludifilum halophilum TaxID=1642702 RepID=A0A235B5R0_9BACL|nr:RNA polymerase subunit sigma [Paludifilum halophilum]